MLIQQVVHKNSASLIVLSAIFLYDFKNIDATIITYYILSYTTKQLLLSHTIKPV